MKQVFLCYLMLIVVSVSLNAQGNRALNFDGTDDAVNLTNGMNTILSTKNTFTVEAWVKPTTNTGYGVIVGNYNTGVATMQFLLRRDNGNISFWVDCGNGWQAVVANNVVTLNTWMHVAGVWDGSTTKIYINGLLQNTTTGVTGATFVSNTNPIIIGKNNINENFTGDIDDVRLWTVAKTATQISENNKKELIGNETGLLAYYKFNNGTANGSNTGVTTLNDNSANSYNGTLTNFALTGTTSNWVNGAPSIKMTYYVTTAGAGTKDGSSWANASDDIQAMINTANSGDKIFVAKGTYKPNTLPRTTDTGNTLITSTNPRDVTFHLKDGVKLYGGFAGTETTLADRDLSLTTNATILSGDIGTAGDNTDNAYHVVISVSNTNATVLDGFTITGGNADGGFNGISVEGQSIKRNEGGGMCNYYNSSPTITNTTFSGNNAAYDGGGMYNSSSSPSITNTTFSGNKASTGGGMYNSSSSPSITNTTFSGNNATYYGGGMRNSSSSSPKIYNSIFWDNKKGTDNNIAEADISSSSSSSPTISHCLTQANSTSQGTNGINNQDPLFVDAANGDFRLQVTSPAINAGNNAPTGVTMPTKDKAGNPRIFQVVDMGAYESQNPVLNPTANVVYVKKGGAGTQDGSSWANAINELAHALKWANTQPTSVANNLKIYVAKGTYKPMYRADNMSGANANDRDNAFVLINNVKIYGGFTGTETGDETTRTNIQTTNKTTLSGDFNGNDGANFTNNGENAHHVVISVNDTNATVLDGFTITGGNANDTNNTTITVEIKNIYRDSGGGMYNDSSSPTLTNTTFSGNTAYYGGGMYNDNSSSPTLTNTTFSGNTATYGGGMYNHSSSSPTLTNTTFSGNTAIGGGGMYNYGSSSPKIYNSIFWDNQQGTANNVTGADIENFSSSPIVTHCLTQENSTHSTGTGIINNQNPLFVNAANGDFRLQAGSPAINAGNNAPTGVTMPTKDAAGNPRQDGIVDMGSYEFVHPKTYYVTEAGAGSKDGSSWANASDDIQAMINTANSGDKIFVAKGTYKPERVANNVIGAKTPNDRDNAFLLKDGVKLYGGFAGTEATLADRDLSLTANTSMLSGDFNDDDGANFTNNGENAYHIVISVSDSNATVLDGFTITGGNANHPYEGSINVESKSIFKDLGSGMYNDDSFLSITNTTFSGNGVGGMFNYNSFLSITNSTFSGNKTTSSGGGMSNTNSSPTITNTTFSGNTATSNGGGIYNYNSSPKIYNSIFWDNKKGTANNVAGADIENFSSSPTVTHCLTQENSTHSTGTGIINNQNPLFVNAANGDFRLQPGSPAINAGNNTPTGVTMPTIDANGNPRQYNSTTVDMGAYEHQDEFNYWNGTTDANWATTSNWSKNTVPTSSETEPTIIVATATNMPVVSGTTGVSLNNLIVQNGASFTIQNDATLQVSGYAKGEFTYQRSLTDKWHLVAVPLTGETIEDVRTLNTTLATSGTKVGFSTYNNLLTTNPRWEYYLNTATGNLTDGKGYATKLATAGNITFKGGLQTKNVAYTLVEGTATGQNNYNLVGNPYAAYLNTATLLSNETTNIDNTVWLWDAANNVYITKNQAHSYKVAPGQAFFVKAKTTNAITFTKAMQSTTGDTFLRSQSNQLITLNLTDGVNKRYTEIFYINGKTKGFDNGYDSETFNGVTQNFEVYTDLVETDGKKYAVQTLPNQNHSDMVVPLGITAKAGKELTFNSESTNLPSDLQVYLEDRKTGEFTNISDNNYTVTISENLNGLGRFYLHATSQALSNDVVSSLSGISIIKIKDNQLIVKGIQQEKADLKLFTILGKEAFSTSFTGTGVNTVVLPKVATGIYIVQLQTAKGKISKKIVLE